MARFELFLNDIPTIICGSTQVNYMNGTKLIMISQELRQPRSNVVDAPMIMAPYDPAYVKKITDTIRNLVVDGVNGADFSMLYC